MGAPRDVGIESAPCAHPWDWSRGSGNGCDARRLSTGRSIRAWRTLCGRQMTGATRLNLRPPKQRRIGGWGVRTKDPRPKILGHIGRGAHRMTRGGVRVSVRRSVQAVCGFVVRQRPRVGSRARYPQPSLIGSSLAEDVPLGRPSSGRPIASFMGSTDACDVRDHSPCEPRAPSTSSARL